MVSNIFRVLISNGIVALVGLISSLLLPNLLSIDDYAEYQTFIIYICFFSFLYFLDGFL